MADSSRHILTIFGEALERASHEDQASYLERACHGDAELRARVEALLQAHRESGKFLAGNPDAPRPGATVEAPVAEKPGTVIGPYKLLEQIGEGGFGVVFMAEQTQPVRRKVALKVLKPGMDTRQVVVRFEAERQALAIMDHPNIAKVFDGGCTGGEAGGVSPARPYFVMELVKGVPITEFCDQNHLTPRQRLELFVPVCQAVQHAHHKGIIHRDLKPSNVLVTVHDTTPVPKVIDFGVAKALGQELTDKTLFTGFAQMIGTPLYMSPEQAGQSGLDIDTRSDIYSLGVLLYELLTGTTPFDKERFKQAAYDEIRRIIREEEPPKPSTRLSESKDSLPSISVQRQTEPAKLTKLVRGELDWIVMKALEKDRNRRYETANGFAADVQRYLKDEPVQACPPSALYKFRKFTRRHKAALTASALVAAALVLAVTVLAISNVRITREKDEKAEALREKEHALLVADEQRKQAQENLKKAREAVDQMLTRVAEEKLLDVPQMEPLRKALLQDALKFYQGFLQDKSNDPALRLETGKAWRRVGFINIPLAQFGQADKAYQESIAVVEKLVAEFPSEPNYRAALADSYSDLGLLLAYWLGENEGAEKALRQSLTLRERLAGESPNVPGYRSGVADIQSLLANVELARGRSLEGEKLHREALEVSEKLAAEFPTDLAHRSQLAMAYYRLGWFLAGTNRREEAEKRIRQALTIRQKQLAENPGSQVLRDQVSASQETLADVLMGTGRPQEAEAVARQALSRMDKLIADCPNVPPYHAQQGKIYFRLGEVLASDNRPQDAEQAYRQALTILEKAVAEIPKAPSWRGALANTQDRLVHLLKDAGRQKEAEQVSRQAVVTFENLVVRFPSVADYRTDLAARHESLAKLLLDIGQPEQAAQAYQQAIAISAKLVTEFPQTPYYREQLASSHFHLGLLLAAANRSEEAEQAYRQALDLCEKLVTDVADNLECRKKLARCHQNLGSLLLASGRAQEANEEFRKTTEVWCKAAEQFPKNAETKNNAAWFMATCPEPKLRDARRAVELATKAVELAPKEGNCWNTLGAAYCRAGDSKAAIAALEKSMGLRNGGDSFDWFFLAMADWQLGDKEQARKWYDQAVQWMEKNKPQDEELRRFRAEAAELLQIAEPPKKKNVPTKEEKKSPS